jgi:hypothetical protein
MIISIHIMDTYLFCIEIANRTKETTCRGSFSWTHWNKPPSTYVGIRRVCWYRKMSLSVVHREGGMVRPTRPWKVEILLGSCFMLVSQDVTFCDPQGEWNIFLGPMSPMFESIECGTQVRATEAAQYAHERIGQSYPVQFLDCRISLALHSPTFGC